MSGNSSAEGRVRRSLIGGSGPSRRKTGTPHPPTPLQPRRRRRTADVTSLAVHAEGAAAPGEGGGMSSFSATSAYWILKFFY